MNVITLHPEELLDRDRDGSLSPAERNQLDAHLAGCPECRLTQQATADFAAERADSQVCHQLSPSIVNELERQVSSASQGAAAKKTRWLKQALGVAAALLAASTAAASATYGTYWSLGPAESAEAPMTATATAQAKPAAPGPALPQAQPDQPEETQPEETQPEETRPEETGPQLTPPTKTPSTRAALPRTQPKPALDTATAMFSKAGKARREGQYERAIELYRELQRSHPKSAEAKASQAILARLLLDRGRAGAALDGFKHYLEGQDRALSEEAMLGRAVAYQKLGRTAAERTAWQALLKRYPSSVHAGRARKRLRALAEP